MKILKEDYGSGFAGRFDDSGIRGKGLVRKPLVRPKNFPYDRQNTYGEPMDYDRGSRGSGGLHHAITPKDTTHSAWEDLEEVTGSPIFLSKAYGSQLGHSTGVPGASGGWATNPAKDWDPEVSDCKFDIFGEGGVFDTKGYTMDPKMPEPELPPNPESPYFHDKTDDDLEKKIDRIFRRGDEYLGDPEEKKPDDHDIYVIGTDHPFIGGIGNSFRSLRGLGGLIPKESVWDFLKGK